MVARTLFGELQEYHRDKRRRVDGVAMGGSFYMVGAVGRLHSCPLTIPNSSHMSACDSTNK